MKKTSESKTKKNNPDVRKIKKNNPGVRNINFIKIEPTVFLQYIDLKNKNKNKNKNKVPNREYTIIDGMKIKRPLYSQYLDIIRQNNDNKSAPAKRKQRPKKILSDIPFNNNNKSKIKKNTNNNLISRVQTREGQIRNNNINKNKIKRNYPYKMNEQQIYEMFLKIRQKTDLELNELPYKRALQFDKRTYCGYYISLIRTKHLLFFSFWNSFDYNSRILKIFLFFFNFTVSFMVNALFFNDDTMHKIYEEKGSFDFIYNIPQILYSSLISGFINGLIRTLAVTDSNVLNFKQNATKNDVNKKHEETIKVIKMKYVLFFIITSILLVAFWFYLACFCAVYKNTQIHLIKDTLISFGTAMIYHFGIYLFPGIFRLPALHDKEQDKEFMFKLSKALQLI